MLVDLEAMFHTQAVRHQIGEMAPGETLSVPIKFLLPRILHDCSQRWELSLRPRSRENFGWGDNFSLAKGRFQRLATAASKPPGLVLGAMPTETQVEHMPHRHLRIAFEECAGVRWLSVGEHALGVCARRVWLVGPSRLY